MTNIFELCKEGFEPKCDGNLKRVLNKAKKFDNSREIRIIRESELVKDNNYIDCGNYVLYIKV